VVTDPTTVTFVVKSVNFIMVFLTEVSSVTHITKVTDVRMVAKVTMVTFVTKVASFPSVMIIVVSYGVKCYVYRHLSCPNMCCGM
jgi:hypothetical protein